MMDKKGRIFGKLNIVDLLVIVLVLVVAAVLGVKFLGKGGDALGGGAGTPVRYTVLVTGVEPQVYENLQGTLPSQLMASGSLVDGAQVVGVTAVPGDDTVNLTAGNQLVVLEGNTGLLDLTFTVEARVADTVTFECGKQEIRIGKKNIVKTVDFELENGIILSREILEK